MNFPRLAKCYRKKKWKWEIFTMTRNGSVTLRLGGKLYFNYRNWIMSVWKLSTWMEIGFRVEFHSTVTSTSPPWLTYSPPFFFLLQVEIIILGWTWVKRSFTIPSTTAVKASAALWMFIRARRKAKLHFFHIVFTSNKTESRERWQKRRRKWNSSLFVLLPRHLVVFSRIFKLLFASGEGENSLRQHRGEWNSASHGRQLKHVAGRLKIARKNVLREGEIELRRSVAGGGIRFSSSSTSCFPSRHNSEAPNERTTWMCLSEWQTTLFAACHGGGERW